jgi:hypothetical protein
MWRATLASPVRRAPLIDGPSVYVATGDARVISLDVKTGRVAWERKLGGAAGDLVAGDTRLYVGGTDKLFYCLSLNDGEIRWSQRTGGTIVGAPAVDESRVYMVSRDGLLRAFDRGHGALRWKHAFPATPSSGPILLGEMLMLPGVSPELRTYARKDGKPGVTYQAPNMLPGTHQALAAPPKILLRPGAEGRTLYFLTLEGQFVAVRRDYEVAIQLLKDRRRTTSC